MNCASKRVDALSDLLQPLRLFDSWQVPRDLTHGSSDRPGHIIERRGLGARCHRTHVRIVSRPDSVRHAGGGRRAVRRPSISESISPVLPTPCEVRSSNMRVRSACERDAGDIAELLFELGYPTDESTTVQRLRGSEELMLVAVDECRVIGLAALAISRTLTHAGPIGRLTALVVSAAHRRQGVARLLVTTVLELAERRGCEGLELTSGLRPEREAAHAFYEALGFERSSYRYWRPVRPHDPSPASPAA